MLKLVFKGKSRVGLHAEDSMMCCVLILKVITEPLIKQAGLFTAVLSCKTSAVIKQQNCKRPCPHVNSDVCPGRIIFVLAKCFFITAYVICWSQSSPILQYTKYLVWSLCCWLLMLWQKLSTCCDLKWWGQLRVVLFMSICSQFCRANYIFYFL